MDLGDPTGDPAAGERRRTGQDPLLLLQALQTLWSTRERQQLREEAWRGFAALDDPLAGLLDMLESCRGRRGEGPSLEAWISHQLQCWLQAQPRPSPAQHSLRLKQLQARAVRVLTESSPSLVAPLASIFQLQDADRSCLLVHVHRLHHEGRFREAVMLGTTLKLQPELDVEKMSIPLLLQDKVGLVERYVAGFPDLQRRLLALMDSWCQPGFDIRDVARQYPEVTSLRLEKLSPKVLSRQVLRLQERYSVAPAVCPNAAIQQRLAALQHLCHKRFVEKSLSQENWTDHVQGLVGQSPCLQEQLSQLLVSHGDPVTAAQCAMDLSLPEERLPAAVAVELHRLRLQGRATEADSRLEVKDMKDQYYQLPIPRENVHLLASWEDLTRHEGALLQRHQVVGVDLEWTPVFVAGGRPRPSLLQVAVEGHVFLLDILALSQPPTGQGAQAFSRLVAQLLSDPSITKLGYGMVGDLQKLGTSCPTLAHVEKQILGSIDLLLVHRQMRVANMLAPGVDRARGLRGLSLLVQQVLGTALDKTQQLSNWDRRPLCEEQLIYAAADAYCLLEVHQALCREPARFHLSEDLAGSRRPRHRERPEARKPPGLPKASASAAPRQVPVAEGTAPQVPARAFRVVCDNMLQGLARSLRCLGVDARMLGDSEDHRRAAEVARQEGRVILTSGQPFHKLRAQVGAGRCLSVDCSLKAQQQAKAVLKHFNVRVTHADIFSRCQFALNEQKCPVALACAPAAPSPWLVASGLDSSWTCLQGWKSQACNCDQYLKVSRDMMKQLMWLSGHQEGPRSSGDEATQSQEVQEPGPAPEAAPGGCTYDRPCRWLQTADLRAETPDVLANGTRLQLAGVPVGVLRTPGLRYFYCCTRCGKVFWDGSHLGRVATHFRDVLESTPSHCELSPAPSPASSPF
ncbi:exonuclease mut-7 homolog isoform X1 [Symphalangus syndactylus]|uniref:exonuclease mut-7 homolog isoform X1 n=2 Tax=Symphalangus syndactylus TaxID=9590 RepID=UPI0024410ADD|nr:exonuclease mut-7 homolog isoform X1 [Symphalangus syndactylus]XP_055126156.1 exonuclease mut-7 homolog isoform X1 [Symphalangus syndactylus]XP_055126157.1 exonuclease mut-7 homolog isoform X1 [Symphalangus syndactylus]